MERNIRKIALPILAILLAAAAWWYLGNVRASADTGELTASGTIEATQVIVAPELEGLAAEVSAKEGDQVQAGVVLVRFEGSLLEAQFKQAQAALSLAQANYNLVVAGPAEEQRQLAIASAQMELTKAQQNLDDLYDTADLVNAQAQKGVADSRDAVDKAQQLLDNMEAEPDPADVEALEAGVVLSEKILQEAKDAYSKYRSKSDKNTKKAVRRVALAVAQRQYDWAVNRLNYLEGKPNDIQFAKAEANLAMAEAQLAEAQRQYDKTRQGPDPDKLALAEAGLKAAKAHLAAAQAGPSQEQLAVAQAQVDSARAGLEVIQTQLEKLVLSAPTEGVVLTRSVEPGEVVLPGSPVMTLARLDNLFITVYLPEDRYGVVSLGQRAQVTVDSFPGTTFTATVDRIADKAEFTPRNVQTAEGRRSTVFAVRLSIDNPEGKLKPGMPADVLFGE